MNDKRMGQHPAGTTKTLLNNVVVLRAAATVLVVLGHATRNAGAPNPHMYEPAFTPAAEVLIKTYVYSFHMPLFFWISGYVFCYGNTQKRSSSGFEAFLVKRIQRLLVPMYSASYLVLLPTISLVGHVNGSLANQAGLFLRAANNDHLWFLAALLIISLITLPAIEAITGTWRYSVLFVGIWSILLLKAVWLPGILRSVVEYLPFYVLGYASRKHENQALATVPAKGAALIAACALHLGFLLLLNRGVGNFLLRTCLWYCTAALGICVMYWLSNIVEKRMTRKGAWLLIRKIDRSSFSIYLFHVTVIYVVLYLFSSYSLGEHLLRVLLSFSIGIALPMVLHEKFARYRILSYLFSIPYVRLGRPLGRSQMSEKRE